MKRLVIFLSCVLLTSAIIWKFQLHSGQEVEFEQFQELPHDLQKKIFLEIIKEENTVYNVIDTINSLLLTSKDFKNLIQSGDRSFTNLILEHCVNLFFAWQEKYIFEEIIKSSINYNEKVIEIYQDFISDKNDFIEQIKNLSRMLNVLFDEKDLYGQTFLEVLQSVLDKYPFFAKFLYFDIMFDAFIHNFDESIIINFDLPAIKLLVKYRFDIMQSSLLFFNFSPLMLAVWTNNIDLVKYLIMQGVDINHKDVAGNTALIHAAIINFVEAVELLLELNEIDINYQGPKGLTALIGAIDNENTDIAIKLINLGADINLALNDGNTPLMIAVLHENAQLIRLLLKHGVNVLAENENRETALDLAKSMENQNEHIIFILEVAELRAQQQELR